LLLYKPSMVNHCLKKFHSVLAIPREDHTGVVRIIHAAFHDFLTDRTRCSDRLFVQPALQHQEITISLFKYMMSHLPEDAEDDKVTSDIMQDCTDSVLIYACRYWADHLSYTTQDGSNINELVTALEKFEQTKLSQWTKTLSIVGSFDVTAAALQKTRRWHAVCSSCIIF
jgi:hypothetical protein